MLKRVGAWIMLAGFVLLLLNLMVFHFYMMECLAVYVFIAVLFILNSKPLPSRKKKKGPNTYSNNSSYDDNNSYTDNYIDNNEIDDNTQDSDSSDTDCGDCDSDCDCGDCSDCDSGDSSSD
jgi:hypothetical protein